MVTIAVVVLPFWTARERKNVPTARDHVAYGYCTTERGELARLCRKRRTVRSCHCNVLIIRTHFLVNLSQRLCIW